MKIEINIKDLTQESAEEFVKTLRWETQMKEDRGENIESDIDTINDIEELIEGTLDAHDEYVKIKEELSAEDWESHNALIRCKMKETINEC